MNTELVSILIPVYNREKFIRETVESALNQTYKNIEIVIVDNKSTDNTFEILKEFARSHPHVRVYQNKENIGPVRNWRRCLDYATGEYVKILWSDDLIAPTFIEKTLPYLLNYKDVGFVFTGTEIFNDKTGQREKAYFIGNTGIYDTKIFIEGSLLDSRFPSSPGNALFRKKDLDKNILLDIPNKIGSDFKMHAIGPDDLIYLLTAKDYPKFAFVNEMLSSFRTHKDSITTSSSCIKKAVLYYIAKAHFVENYITDIKLKKKFNARLLGICILNMFLGKYGGITTIKDFYFENNKTSIDIIYLLGFPIKKIVKWIHKARQGKSNQPGFRCLSQ